MSETTSQAGVELLEAIGQMRQGERARVYTPEHLLAISAQRSKATHSWLGSLTMPSFSPSRSDAASGPEDADSTT